ncbi:MAG TPA: hypothetical protein VFS10_15600 [Pyrinomonadaceae bacterium]|nr:hypothetical protein [Pyrinomonadaceae bacterium]
MRSNGRRRNVLTGALFAALVLCSASVASAQDATTSGTKIMPEKTTAPYSTEAVTSIGLDAGVTSLAADANGNIYASLQFSKKVVKLNSSGTVVGTFAVGANPTGLVVDNANGHLYVLNNSDNTVSKLKLDGTPVGTYTVGGDGPVHAALLGSTLYIACERSNTLVRMSTSGAALGSTPVGKRPVWVVVASSSSKTFTSLDDGTMTADAEATSVESEPTAVEGETMTVEGETTTVEGDAAMASKPSSVTSVYVSCNKSDEVWKLSTSGGVVGKYATPRGPFGLAVNSKGEMLVACFWDGIVYRMSAAGVGLSKTAVGDGAAGVVAYGNVLAVISNGANTLTRLSLADGLVISKDLVDRAPLAGAATSSALWVGCTGGGTIARRSL